METSGLLQQFESSAIAALVDLRQKHWKECTNVINGWSFCFMYFDNVGNIYLICTTLLSVCYFNFRHSQAHWSTSNRFDFYNTLNCLDFETGLNRVNSEKAELIKCAFLRI